MYIIWYNMYIYIYTIHIHDTRRIPTNHWNMMTPWVCSASAPQRPTPSLLCAFAAAAGAAGAVAVAGSAASGFDSCNPGDSSQGFLVDGKCNGILWEEQYLMMGYYIYIYNHRKTGWLNYFIVSCNITIGKMMEHPSLMVVEWDFMGFHGIFGSVVHLEVSINESTPRAENGQDIYRFGLTDWRHLSGSGS